MNSVRDLSGTSTIKADGTLGLTGRRITGVRCVLEQCVRAVVTPRGTLRHAPDEGEDIRELENGDFSPTQLERKRASYDAQMRKVPFVVGVKSSIRIDAAHVAHFDAGVVIEGEGTYPLSVKAGPASQVFASVGAP